MVNVLKKIDVLAFDLLFAYEFEELNPLPFGRWFLDDKNIAVNLDTRGVLFSSSNDSVPLKTGVRK